VKKRVLVIGGYGGFGARISRRLASAGYEVLVAGRDARKAAAFCAGQPSLVPTPLPNEQDLAGALERHRPFAVVDAAGPFQGATYRIARACITAGCHCLDIADGREFVAGIGVLDAEARAAGVAIISGASSVPASTTYAPSKWRSAPLAGRPSAPR
jgi:saccharopine dehydrogenase-like NADP-dependent oxidoreductase